MTPNDIGASFPGGSLNAQSERIRVLALNPALANAALEQSAARFDAVFQVGMNWTGEDGQPGIPNLLGNSPSSSLFEQPGQNARFGASIIKPLATGGVANISYFTDYRNLGNNSFLNGQGANLASSFGPFNPQYTTRLSSAIEQPLFGRRRRGDQPTFWLASPASPDSPWTPTPRPPSATISGSWARFPTKASKAFSSRASASINSGRSSRPTSRSSCATPKWPTGTSTTSTANSTPSRKTCASCTRSGKTITCASRRGSLRLRSHNFSRLSANTMSSAANAYGPCTKFSKRSELRGILGLQPEDGERLVPITPPTLAKVTPNWETSLRDALALKPELVLSRDNIRYHQYLFNLQQNNLRPDLRVDMRYEPFGDGNSLTGSGTVLDGSGTPQPANAFRSLASGKLADWQIGVNMVIPLGDPAEMASVRCPPRTDTELPLPSRSGRQGRPLSRRQA